MKKILICTERSLIRYAFSQILLTADEPFIVNETQSDEELFSILDKEYIETTCNIIILDLFLFQNNGLEVIKKIKESYPHIPIVVFSIEFNCQIAPRIMQSGASGYITAESTPEEILQAISKILNGEKYISKRLSEILVSSFLKDSPKPLHATLSDREYQVLMLIASGKTAKQIADNLSISVKSVSTYRARLLEKMKMKTNVELTHYAIQNELL